MVRFRMIDRRLSLGPVLLTHCSCTQLHFRVEVCVCVSVYVSGCFNAFLIAGVTKASGYEGKKKSPTQIGVVQSCR